MITASFSETKDADHASLYKPLCHIVRVSPLGRYVLDVFHAPSDPETVLIATSRHLPRLGLVCIKTSPPTPENKGFQR